MRAGHHQVRAHVETVQKAGTGGDQIETPGALGSDAVLHQAGGGGEQVVGRDRADDDCFDLRRVHAALRQRAPRGLNRHVGGSHLRGGDVALTDARALHDPLIVRVD